MSKKWFYEVMGEELGPVSTGELKKLAREQKISHDTMLRRADDGKSVQACRVRGLFQTSSPEESLREGNRIGDEFPIAAGGQPPAMGHPGIGEPVQETGAVKGLGSSQPQRKIASHGSERVDNVLKLTGVILAAVGLSFIAFFGFVYDTTRGDFYNTGLQLNRLIGCLVSLAVFQIGAFALLLWVHRVFPSREL